MKKYSLQEALRDLRNPKAKLREDVNNDLKAKLEAIKDPIQLVEVYENSQDEYDTLQLAYCEEAALFDYINDYFEDGYDEMGVNLGSSGLAPYNDDDVNGDYQFDNADDVIATIKKYPDSYWFMEGDPELELATKEQVIEQILEFNDPEDIESAIRTYVVDDEVDEDDQIDEGMWWWSHEAQQIDKAKKQMKQGVSKRQFIKNQQKDFPGFPDQPNSGLYDSTLGKNIARSEYNAAKGKSYFKKKNVKEEVNEPANLDYHKGDTFLDMLWDRVSPQYKVAAVEGNWDGQFDSDYDDNIFGEDPITYIVMPESDYNDYAEKLKRAGEDWQDIFEDIMDEYPLLDVWYKDGKIYLFTSSENCQLDFNPDADPEVYKEYNSVDELVSEILGL